MSTGDLSLSGTTGAADGETLPPDLGRVAQEELLSWGKVQLVQQLRRAEADKVAALVQRGRLIQEVNRQLEGHLLEVRQLKAANQRLRDENQELRHLCCFLDEERLKARRLARQWQGFGRHAARVMREDVGGYLRKLAELEQLQGALAQDNRDLQELCLLALDAAAQGNPGQGPGASPAGSSDLNLPCGPRDLGDGSSSAGSVGSPDPLQLACSPED
uniref:coiled-coil domain-containing protein 85B n=1 Tax=Pristiophorus japonicus TaxID=55135 RepID=UPI00398F6834